MIRQIFNRFVEKAKAERARWRNPVPAGAEPEVRPEPEPAPAPKASPGRREEAEARMRDMPRCPCCAKPKELGAMICGSCDEYREPLRRKAAS